MEKPMLYKGFKFDIRVYACLNQDMELHVFKYLLVNLLEKLMSGCHRIRTR